MIRNIRLAVLLTCFSFFGTVDLHARVSTAVAAITASVFGISTYLHYQKVLKALKKKYAAKEAARFEKKAFTEKNSEIFKEMLKHPLYLGTLALCSGTLIINHYCGEDTSEASTQNNSNVGNPSTPPQTPDNIRPISKPETATNNLRQPESVEHEAPEVLNPDEQLERDIAFALELHLREQEELLEQHQRGEDQSLEQQSGDQMDADQLANILEQSRREEEVRRAVEAAGAEQRRRELIDQQDAEYRAAVAADQARRAREQEQARVAEQRRIEEDARQAAEREAAEQRRLQEEQERAASEYRIPRGTVVPCAREAAQARTCGTTQFKHGDSISECDRCQQRICVRCTRMHTTALRDQRFVKPLTCTDGQPCQFSSKTVIEQDIS